VRAVVDANTWVAALMRRGGAPVAVLDAFMSGQFTLVASEPILSEFLLVLRRPRIARLCGLTPDDVESTVAYLRERAEMVPLSGGYTMCRDPEDDKLIETALRGAAPVIVSRDQDLHDPALAARLRPLGVRALHPEEFLRLLRSTL